MQGKAEERCQRKAEEARCQGIPFSSKSCTGAKQNSRKSLERKEGQKQYKHGSDHGNSIFGKMAVPIEDKGQIKGEGTES